MKAAALLKKITTKLEKLQMEVPKSTFFNKLEALAAAEIEDEHLD